MKLQALKELIEQREEDPSMVQLGQAGGFRYREETVLIRLFAP